MRNILLKNDFDLNLRGFGNFIIKDVKEKTYNFGNDRIYTVPKKRRVTFKYLNKVFK